MMKILSFRHKNNWVTNIRYRKTTNDLVIQQYRLGYMKHPELEFRQIYLWDEEKDVIKELLKFLKGLKGEKK